MQKTLSQLKKDIVIGTKIECTYFNWTGTTYTGVPEKMQGIRTVESKNTVGFVLNGSHFDWPKSSELVYEDNTITVSPRNQEGKVFQVRKYTIIN
jgi:hypothetical protein